VLFGPATESCTYVVIAPAVAWILLDAFGRPGSWGIRSLGIACLFFMGLFVTDLFGSRMRNYATDHGSQPIGAILFAALLLWQLAGQGQTKRPISSPESPQLPAAA
jgi:hypothetical protein